MVSSLPLRPGELVDVVEPAGAFRGVFAKLGVSATTSDDFRAVPRRGEHSTVTETAVRGEPRIFRPPPASSNAPAHISHDPTMGGQIVFLCTLPGTPSMLLGAFLARFVHAGPPQTNGERSATALLRLCSGHSRDACKKPQPQHKIGVKRGRKGVALIKGLLNATPGLVQFGVVHGHSTSARTLSERPRDNGIKQSLRLPRDTGMQKYSEDQFRCSPPLAQMIRVNVRRPNRLRRQVPAVCAVAVRFCGNTASQDCVRSIHVSKQRHDFPSLTANVFGVRTKRFARITFLVSADTRLSRSTATWKDS